MKRTFNIFGRIAEDGKSFLFESSAHVLLFLKEEFLGKDLELTVNEVSYKRTSAQNRYLWGVIYPAIQKGYLKNTGEKLDLDTIHAHNLSTIQGYKTQVSEMFGQLVVRFDAKSTAKMNVEEFSDLVEKIKKYYAEKDIYIPDATKHNFLNDF